VNFFKSVNIWQSYKQEHGCLVHFRSYSFSSALARRTKCMRQIFTDLQNFSVADLYLIGNRLFSDINVSHGSVAPYARCGGIFNKDLNQKKWGHKLMAIILSNLNRFSNFFTERFIGKFAVSDLTELRPWVCGPTFLAHPVESAGEMTSFCQSHEWA